MQIMYCKGLDRIDTLVGWWFVFLDAVDRSMTLLTMNQSVGQKEEIESIINQANVGLDRVKLFA